MNITPELAYQIITVVLIPILVGLWKRFGLSPTYAPTAAFGVSLGLVLLGRVFGLTLDAGTIQSAVLTALASAGIAVIGYDQAKKLTEIKK